MSHKSVTVQAAVARGRDILEHNNDVTFTRDGEFFLDISSDVGVLVDDHIRRTRMRRGVYRHATIS